MMVAAGERGAPITVVAQPSQLSTLRMVSLADDPIEGPDDLRGRTTGIPSEGGTGETLVDMLSATGGLAEADVAKQVVGVAPGVFDLVRQGRIDGYVVSMDTARVLASQNPDVVVLDPARSIASGTQVYITSRAAVDDPAQRDGVPGVGAGRPGPRRPGRGRLVHQRPGRRLLVSGAGPTAPRRPGRSPRRGPPSWRCRRSTRSTGAAAVGDPRAERHLAVGGPG
jgi:NMT1/THI5 like protein